MDDMADNSRWCNDWRVGVLAFWAFVFSMVRRSNAFPRSRISNFYTEKEKNVALEKVTRVDRSAVCFWIDFSSYCFGTWSQVF